MAPAGETLGAWARPLAAQAALCKLHPELCYLKADQDPCFDFDPKQEADEQEQWSCAKEADEQEQRLCPECHLPIGKCWYQELEEPEDDSDEEVIVLKARKAGQAMHGECKAQLVLKALQEEEEARLADERELKRSRRAEYDIGWKAERIPDSAARAGELLGRPAKGLFSLVYDEGLHTVRVVPTTDVGAAVNLEYLSLALQVRKKEGREPLFSLDPEDDSVYGKTFLDEEPVDHLAQIKDLMQHKRFEPSWLAGTSVGEVMFQADYHLKELSMGEHEQPVAGMKSCSELSTDEDFEEAWQAREWFVVQRADMYISEGNALIPHVEMGVEARELVPGDDGALEDAKVTRPDHPLVQYAEVFTHFFDLIAERKSVVYHLRELAKASVLAKFLLDDELVLEDAWFSLAMAEGEDPHPEIPQLWNARLSSRIHMCGGEILRAGDDDSILDTAHHSVYGGVEFGIDRMKQFPSFSRRLPSTGEPELRYQALGATTLPGQRLGARPQPARVGLRPPARAFVPSGALMARPQGVDLNLDRFSLSSTTRVTPQSKAGSWGCQEGVCLIGDSFWSHLSNGSSGSPISKGDKTMLKALFNPRLSDRRTEGERFAPPDTSPEYVEKLQSLLEEEEVMRQQRREYFLGKGFSPQDVGPLFPSSWNSSFTWARSEALKRPVQGACWEGRVPDKEEAEKLEGALRSAAPAFDKIAEDGTRYRVYQVGNREVRTTQELGGKELVGVIFAQVPEALGAGPAGEALAKVTEYVERLDCETTHCAEMRPPPHGYFVVIETEAGDEIVSERLADGVVSWEMNPKDLAARTALAKVIATVDGSGGRVLLLDLKQHRDKEQKEAWCAFSGSAARKRYAHHLFSLALPVWEKAWASLTSAQGQAAEKLGVGGEESWDGCRSEVWQCAWTDLTDRQQEAARALGVEEASWLRLQVARGARDRSWAELSRADRRAAEELEVAGQHAWESAAPEIRQRVLGSLWERPWEQLSEEEREAARQLGIDDSEQWDAASWQPEGAWAVRWHRISEEQQEAAAVLGLSGPSLWEKALADKLANHWGVTAWDRLTLSQKATAARLGYSRSSWFGGKAPEE